MTEQIVVTNARYSSQLTGRLIGELAEQYAFISSFSVGKSVMGNALQVMCMGEGEKELLIQAAHHANEWITTPIVLKFAEDYAKAIRDKTTIMGFDAVKLFKQTKLYIMPLVNPDGVDLVNGFAKGILKENAQLIAENYPNVPFPSGWKANILGTDLNLNYPADWIKARRIKYAKGFVSPAPRDFVGFYPLSAPESKALYEFTLSKDFAMILAYHTQGDIIYWKYDGYDPMYAKEIVHILSKASGYTPELTPEYASYAGYKDWFIKNYNRPGYTIECGRGKNPLPISDFDQIYRVNLPLMLSALDAVAVIL